MEWQLSSPGKEYDRHEGMVVYYHQATGNTHLVSDIAAEILRDLRGGALSEEYLEEQYGNGIVDSVLHDMRNIHLVEAS